MKYALSILLISGALIAGKTLVPVQAMAPTQFGEFTEGYLKRKAAREEQRKNRPVKRSKCHDFGKDETPRGFVRALEEPTDCTK